ncbi:hypothetical protein K492DRAFT_239440 [Lichtheimia hyalospora FSU 10163]|nr:hypothetical protein K492DRAFT_239440 [Lichtheimia hyalospora FSU 10163]
MFADTAPIVNIDLPAPIILSCVQLLSLHLSLFCIDYVVARHEYHIPILLQGARLRVILAIIHFLIPMVFACSNFYINGMLIGAPWFIAAKIVQHASNKNSHSSFSIMHLVYSISSMDASDITNEERVRIRIQGLAKVARGAFKWAFMKSIIDPQIPADYGLLLTLPYWSLYSLWLTAVLGIKVYCLCGLSDLSFGLQQFILGIPFMDMFDSPLMAHSLRDFWSRRWNLLVKTLLHEQFFATRISSPQQSHYHCHAMKSEKKTSSQRQWCNSRVLRGLFIFFVSGLFHEVMLAAVARKVTFEQILFFTLQGILVLVEIKLLDSILRPDKGWMHRTICILFNFVLLTVTGRLFLAPYIRTDMITRIFG